MLTKLEKEFLRSHSICRLATVSPSGQPHNVPVGYSLDDQYFYLTTDPGTVKLNNIRYNQKVCLLVDESQKPRRAMIIRGMAELIEGGPVFDEAMTVIANQRGWKKKASGEQVVIRVTPSGRVAGDWSSR